MKDRAVWVAFVLYLLFYVPLILLSNGSGLPPLAVLPVSTASCCVFALLVAAVGGWWRYAGPSRDRTAALRASPATGAIVLLTPLAYAAAGAAVLATLTIQKAGSILVTLWHKVGGTAQRPDGQALEVPARVKLAAVLCVVAIVVAAYGNAIVGLVLGRGWSGGALSWAGLLIAGLYVVNYAWRVKMMVGHKSMAFYAIEHLLAPHFAMAVIGLAGLAGLAARRAGTPIPLLEQIVLGFQLWDRLDLWALGLCSQAVGLAGGWILVDRALSVGAMTLNRSAALLAGGIVLGINIFRGAEVTWSTLQHSLGALTVPMVLVLMYGQNPAVVKETPSTSA